MARKNKPKGLLRFMHLPELLDRLPEFEENFSRINSDGLEAIRPYWEPFFEVMTRISDLYLTATDEERAEVRRMVRELRTVCWAMFTFIGYCGDQAAEEREIEWLRRALIGASIQDNQVDYRDTYELLGRVYEQARAVNLSPAPLFKEIGAISSRESFPGGGTMYDFLTRFMDSLYFKGYVKH